MHGPEMISLIISIEISPYKMIEFEQAVKEMISKDNLKKTNLYRAILRDMEKPNSFLYMEDWESRKAFNQHFKTDSFRSIIGGMKVLGTITSAHIKYDTKTEQINV